MRVLLIEDNALNSELARDLLEMGGHDVTVATNGAALRQLLTGGVRADIVLMDILLPDANGVELLAEVRASRELAQVPVVALTAQALTGDEGRLRAAGFAAVITKPIDTRGFEPRVRELAWRES